MTQSFRKLPPYYRENLICQDGKGSLLANFAKLQGYAYFLKPNLVFCEEEITNIQ